MSALPPFLPPMVLNLHGGGVKGIVSLCLLDAVEEQVKQLLGPLGVEYSEDLKPCQYFKLICGTSTGAIIAIMLGRLQMTIGECKRAYRNLAEKIFGASWLKVVWRWLSTLIHRPETAIFPYKFNQKRLEKVVNEVLAGLGLDIDEPLIPDPSTATGPCKVLMPVVEIEDERFVIRLLRTYGCSDGGGAGWTIKAAIMAATAAPSIFPSYRYNNKDWADAAAWSLNNPARITYLEMKKLWAPHCKEVLFLDVGTGTLEDSLETSDFAGLKFLTALFRKLRTMYTSPEEASELVRAACNNNIGEITYYRLDVKFPREWKLVGPGDYKKLSQLENYVVGVLRTDSELNEHVQRASRRIVDALTGTHSKDTSPSLELARFLQCCNLIKPLDTHPGVCFLNGRDSEFFLRDIPAEWTPYTSQNLPEAFAEFREASGMIRNAIVDGPELEPAILLLRRVKEVQCAEFKRLREQGVTEETCRIFYSKTPRHPNFTGVLHFLNREAQQ
ncbi:acyl transferase/acyl hydrolase/lysophospholipase [Sphaerosporella brunnea]|uniref:Acyl transferase/acyl hydrolase/lysophospholipase n=1 Tax=Sphaerosporella brunnea TaxID=1250544 RepID=A0A5J5EMV8_9PEZI|nr:acyl transferase/acyl hydrolase/lysophospholipase [Sphaerosporella brunnea]